MQDSPKERIDALMVKRGLASSREKAKQMVMAGQVFIAHQKVEKWGKMISSDVLIDILGTDMPFVSRGGLKLEKALTRFQVPVAGRCYMDIGASTGGFTQCLLMHGAIKVYAIDVGTGQLASELRQDGRVVVMERTNIRHVTEKDLDTPPTGAVIDVSFISLKLVLPVVKALLSEGSHIIALIKPQFEAGKGRVGKKGVVREPALHKEIILELLNFIQGLDLTIMNLSYSPVKGPEGNIEFLIHLYKSSCPIPEQENSIRVETVVEAAHQSLNKK